MDKLFSADKYTYVFCSTEIKETVFTMLML